VSIVVIAHRPRILQTADKILVLRAGAVQDLGPRDEVLAKLIRPAGARGRPPDADRRVREP
jgi:ABC-type protease/lipase transport system fused ATPase/permease subunit